MTLWRKRRGAGLSTSIPATYFRTAFALVCSWDANLVRRVGVSLATCPLRFVFEPSVSGVGFGEPSHASPKKLPISASYQHQPPIGCNCSSKVVRETPKVRKIPVNAKIHAVEFCDEYSLNSRQPVVQIIRHENLCCRSQRRNWPTADRRIDSSRAHRNRDVSFRCRREESHRSGSNG